jgi:hypothetical protein
MGRVQTHYRYSPPVVRLDTTRKSSLLNIKVVSKYYTLIDILSQGDKRN